LPRRAVGYAAGGPAGRRGAAGVGPAGPPAAPQLPCPLMTAKNHNLCRHIDITPRAGTYSWRI